MAPEHQHPSPEPVEPEVPERPEPDDDEPLGSGDSDEPTPEEELAEFEANLEEEQTRKRAYVERVTRGLPSFVADLVTESLGAPLTPEDYLRVAAGPLIRAYVQYYGAYQVDLEREAAGEVRAQEIEGRIAELERQLGRPEELGVDELRAVARELGIERRSRLKRAELVARVKEAGAASRRERLESLRMQVRDARTFRADRDRYTGILGKTAERIAKIAQMLGIANLGDVDAVRMFVMGVDLRRRPTSKDQLAFDFEPPPEFDTRGRGDGKGDGA